MTTLIAGVGNIFYADDGFGVEVARRLAADPPAGTEVTDFGIRGLHLAFELAARELVVVVDCASRGGAPGTLYVIHHEGDAAIDTDPHGMSLPAVFATARDLAARLPRVIVVGCEPAVIEPRIGLSPEVAAAIPAAVQLVRDVITQENQR
jgi:hydrogenase maturation protease